MNAARSRLRSQQNAALDQERKTREAHKADQEDAADLEALESTIKRRTKQ